MNYSTLKYDYDYDKAYIYGVSDSAIIFGINGNAATDTLNGNGTIEKYVGALNNQPIKLTIE